MQPQYPAQYPQQPAQPQYPQQPQQGYPPQQYPQQPQQGYPAPQPAYPQQPQQGYPQAYAQPQYAPPAPQGPPLPAVSLDDYWQQPSSSGGPSLKFKDAAGNPQIGKVYEGFVARAVTDSDVRPQTDKYGQAQTYRDGRVKSVMVVPLLVQPTTEFPDGQAGWWVKGQSRDELARAMAEAGAPAGAPEAGAYVRIALVNVRPIPNMSPAFQYRVDYTRPQGAPPIPQAPAQQPAVQAPQPVQQPMPQMAPVMRQQPVPPAPVQQPMPQQAPAPQPVAVAPAPAPGPAGFNPEQQALLAKLTGGQG
jgi:hypothetical protein